MNIDMTKRHDSMEAAEAHAAHLNATTDSTWIAYYTDYACDPFMVAELPKVGDEVSKGFNGDYYPSGKIAKISKTFNRITTTEGDVFTRTGPMKWKIGGKKGAFTLVRGLIDERNPHF